MMASFYRSTLLVALLFGTLLSASVVDNLRFECTEEGLKAAVAHGGYVTLDCQDNVELTVSHIIFRRDISINAQKKLTLRAESGSLFGIIKSGLNIRLEGFNFVLSESKLFAFSENQANLKLIDCTMPSALFGPLIAHPTLLTQAKPKSLPMKRSEGEGKVLVVGASAAACIYPPSSGYTCFTLNDLFENVDASQTIIANPSYTIIECSTNDDQCTSGTYTNDSVTFYPAERMYCFARSVCTAGTVDNCYRRVVVDNPRADVTETAVVLIGTTQASLRYYADECASHISNVEFLEVCQALGTIDESNDDFSVPTSDENVGHYIEGYGDLTHTSNWVYHTYSTNDTMGTGVQRRYFTPESTLDEANAAFMGSTLPTYFSRTYQLTTGVAVEFDWSAGDGTQPFYDDDTPPAENIATYQVYVVRNPRGCISGWTGSKGYQTKAASAGTLLGEWAIPYGQAFTAKTASFTPTEDGLYDIVFFSNGEQTMVNAPESDVIAFKDVEMTVVSVGTTSTSGFF